MVQYYLYIAGYVFLVVSGFFIFKSYFTEVSKTTTVKASKLRTKKKEKKSFKESLENEDVDAAFKKNGIRYTSFSYKFLRILVFAGWGLFMVRNGFIHGHIPLSGVFVYCVLYALSFPALELGGKDTPLMLVINVIEKKNLEEKNKEILRVISQIKNIALTQKDKPLSAEFVLGEVFKFTSKTKPVFGKLIYLWSMGNYMEACEFLAKEVDTPEGRELSNILYKMEYMEPKELNTQLELLQNSISQERKTKREKKGELISNLLYVSVMASTMAVLINFIVVVLFIDMQEMFEMFF